MTDDFDESFLSKFCSCYLKTLSLRWLSYLVTAILLGCSFGTSIIQNNLGSTSGSLQVTNLMVILSGCRLNVNLGPTMIQANMPSALIIYNDTIKITFDPSTLVSSDGNLKILPSKSNYFNIIPLSNLSSSFDVSAWGFYNSASSDFDIMKWNVLGTLYKDQTKQISLNDQENSAYNTPLSPRNVLVGPFSLQDSSARDCMKDYKWALGLACASSVIGLLAPVWKFAINCFGAGLPLYFVAELSPLLVAIFLSINLSFFNNQCNGSTIQGVNHTYLLLYIPVLISWCCCLVRPCLFHGVVEENGEYVTTYTDMITGNKREERETAYRIS